MDKIIINNGGAMSTLWTIGWLFTIGYLHLSFWKGVLAIFVWPYFIGKKVRKEENK